MGTSVNTPVSRIVWGHPTKGQPKKKDNVPVLKDGLPVTQWAFGIAIPKAEFQAVVWPAMAAEIATGFPNGAPQNFAYKFIDGDTHIDQQGNPYNQKPGCAGCMILAVSTELMCPPIYQFNGTSYDQMAPDAIKCGDYVVVSLNLVVNVSTTPSRKSSIYVNPDAIQFIGYGEAIVTTASPQTLFGGQQYALPEGASATPINPAGNVGMPVQQPAMQPAPVQQPAMQPAPVQQPAMQPAPVQPLPTPATNFTQPAPVQPMPGQMPPR